MKVTLTDDDGNEIRPPDPDSDVGRLIFLLEYGRKRGFQFIGPVRIGEVAVQVRDLRQERDQGGGTITESSIWEEHGHREG